MYNVGGNVFTDAYIFIFAYMCHVVATKIQKKHVTLFYFVFCFDLGLGVMKYED